MPFFQSASNDSIGLSVSMLPNEKVVAVYTADLRANRMSFQRNFDGLNYTASMGGIYPLANINIPKFISQLSVAGSTYLTLTRQNNAGSVENVDFFADVFYDIQLTQDWVVRLGTGHSSQHLSDDAIIAGASFKNYVKDYHQMQLVYKLAKHKLQSYAGVYYVYNFKTSSDISKKLMWQFGWEHQPFKTVAFLRHLYYAGDIKFRQELNYAHTLNIQVGYKISNEKSSIFRLAFDYSQGKDERGYYMPAERNYAHIGIYFDF
ncbi:MAG: DUF1207 domain-containing protein [bacterium]|nr:DUF1207 domain-containing protein [bacterium]